MGEAAVSCGRIEFVIEAPTVQSGSVKHEGRLARVPHIRLQRMYESVDVYMFVYVYLYVYVYGYVYALYVLYCVVCTYMCMCV